MTQNKNRHEGTADIAREMISATEPITREMVAEWAKRVVDLGIYGSKTVTLLKERIRSQREVARCYCKYIAKLEERIKKLTGEGVK